MKAAGKRFLLFGVRVELLSEDETTPKLVVIKYSHSIHPVSVPATVISIWPSTPSIHSLANTFKLDDVIVTGVSVPLTSIKPMVVTVQFAILVSVTVSS